MTEAATVEGPAGLEAHHIDVISPQDRRGRAFDLFPVWFSGNLNVGNAVFGALAVAVGNSLGWALLAMLVGNLVGAVFMSLHSVQGARLGVPQLIQSRGQFGWFGSLLPVALAALLYGGFFVTTAIIGGQALNAAAPGTLSVNGALVILAVLSLVIALLGYRAIHLAARWAVWPLAAALVVVSVAAGVHGGISLTFGSWKAGPFFSAVGLFATFLLTYAPYVSDYSRYLPEDTPASAAFGWTFTGVFTSVTWGDVLGIVLATQIAKGDVFQATGLVIGNRALTDVILVVTAVAVAGNNALNLYGGMLNLITGLSTFRQVRPSVLVRALMLLPTFAIGVVLAVASSSNFYAQLNNLLSVLMLGFVPWGTVNLIDFYLVRGGRYDVAGLFRRHGPYGHDPATWTYGGCSLKALLAYAVGVAAALPFVANGWWTGPVAHAWGGADISWVPGLIVTGTVYLGLSRIGRGSPATAPAIDLTPGALAAGAPATAVRGS